MSDVSPAPGADSATISHLAAPGASIDIDDDRQHYRQRCVWCGALIVDGEVEGDVEEVGYEPGTMVRRDLDSGTWFTVDWSDDDDVLADSCMMLPLELTGSPGRPARYVEQ